MPSQCKISKRIQEEQTTIKFLSGLIGCRESEITDNKGNCLLGYNTHITLLRGGTTHVTTHNVFVKCCNQQGVVAGRGSDDTAYTLFPHLQFICPRSYSVNVVKDTAGNQLDKYSIQGIPKFSSRKDGDEDSGIACGNVLLQNIHLATHVLVTKKANGKFALFSMKMIDNVLYGIVGSKNVHRMFPMDKFQEFIDETDGLIKDIATSIKESLSRVSENQLEALTGKLTGGFTAIGEFIDGKHIEISDGVKRIEFFGFTENIGSIPEDYTLTQNPIAAFKEFRALNLPTVSHVLYSISEFNAIDEKSLRSGLTEGKVYYYLESDKVVGIEKFKTVWYTVWGMVREAIKNMKTVETLSSNAKMECSKRLHKRSQDFLNLTDAERFGWEKVIFRFIDWFISKGYTGSDVGHHDTSKGMGTVLGEFQKEFSEETTQPLAKDLDGTRVNVGTLTSMSRKVLVIFQGCTGLGKTTIAMKLLEQFEYPFFEKDRDKDSLNKIEMAMNDGESDTIVYSSNNSGGTNERDVQRLIHIAHANGFKPLFVYPEEFEIESSRTTIRALCLSRMIRREGHPSITKNDMTDEQYLKHCEKILDGFLLRFNKVANNDGVISKALKFLNGGEEEDIDTIVSNLKAIIDEARETEMKVEIVPQFEYLKLNIPRSHKKELQAMIPEMKDLSEGHKTFLQHVTTSTTNDNDPQWGKKKAHKHARTSFRIVPYSYYHKIIKGLTCIVILVDLFDKTGKESMNHLVFSGVPHITTVLPTGMAPKESIRLVKTAQKGDIKKMEVPEGYFILSTMC